MTGMTELWTEGGAPAAGTGSPGAVGRWGGAGRAALHSRGKGKGGTIKLVRGRPRRKTNARRGGLKPDDTTVEPGS